MANRRSRLRWARIAGALGTLLPLAALGGALSMLAGVEQQERSDRASLDQLGTQLVQSVNWEWTSARETLQVAAAMMAADNVADWRQFSALLGESGRAPFVRFVAWAPLVDASHRAAFEESSGNLGYRSSRITELAPDGTLEAAAVRTAYLPIQFVHPARANQSALGTDLLSLPALAPALDRARRSRAAQLVVMPCPGRPARDQSCALTLQPVFARAPAGERTRGVSGHLTGVAVVLVSLETMLDKVAATLGVQSGGASIVRQTPAVTGRRLAGRGRSLPLPPEPANDPAHWRGVLDLGPLEGDRFELRLAPSRDVALNLRRAARPRR